MHPQKQTRLAHVIQKVVETRQFASLQVIFGTPMKYQGSCPWSGLFLPFFLFLGLGVSDCLVVSGASGTCNDATGFSMSFTTCGTELDSSKDDWGGSKRFSFSSMFFSNSALLFCPCPVWSLIFFFSLTYLSLYVFKVWYSSNDIRIFLLVMISP